MPRYYIHIRDRGQIIVHDSEGVELTDWSLQPDEWREILKRILHEESRQEDLIDVLEFQVVDQSGQTVVILPFRSVLAGLDA